MWDVAPVVASKFAELAKMHDVVFQHSETNITLSGLIDNIYNLRAEVDAVLLWTAKQKTPHYPIPPEPTGNPGGYLLSHVSPPPGMPAHMWPSLLRSSSAPATPYYTPQSTNSSAMNNSNSTLSANVSATPGIGTTPGSSSSQESTVPNDHGREKFSTPPSSPTLPAPIVRYDTTKDVSATNDQVKDHPAADHLPSGASSDTEPNSPSHGDNGDKEKTNVFTNLNPDALALLQRLPEGNIPGIEYNTREGCVRILLQDEGEVQKAISNFQQVYNKVTGRRLRAENVAIPAVRSKEEVESKLTEFEQKYMHCAFVLDEGKQQVRVISQSRQFEQAKQFLSDALRKPSTYAASLNVASDMATSPIVITLPTHRKLTLKKGDIVKEKVDILVNAANGRLRHGGGVAGALNDASERKLQMYCNDYMETKRNGKELPVGEVAVTHGGGNLKCYHVIHAVGPMSSKHSPTECERLVKVAICNTLKAAEQLNATSIALPALSCGIFGVSKDLVAHSIIDAIRSFNYTKPPPVLSDIRIVILDESTHTCFTHYFEQDARPFRRASENTAVATPDHKPQHSKLPRNGGRKASSADGML